MKAQVVDFHRLHKPRRGDARMMVQFTPGWLGRLLGRKQHTRTFYGSGTVWREMDAGRPGTLMEGLLADLYTNHILKEEGIQ